MPVRVPDLDWTVERALALPDDGNRYEVLDGELFVTPAPTFSHQAVCTELEHRLGAHLRGRGIGRVLHAPADITFSPRRLVQPDIFVIAPRPEAPVATWADVKELLLAVEVISPSTARADRYRKRAIYMEEAVGEYWIIDGYQRLVERWTRGATEPEILTDELVWTPSDAAPPFRLDLAEFFREIEAYASRP